MDHSDPPSEVGSTESPADRRTDYTGAVYGSMLAASVVATAGAVGDYPRLNLALMLIVTGLVFWAVHVYARVAGQRRTVGSAWSWREIRSVSVHEWSIVEAAFLPTVAVAISPLLGLDLTGTAWFALGIAVAQQVGWACLGAVRASLPRRQVALECVVNLVLGLILMAAKAAISH